MKETLKQCNTEQARVRMLQNRSDQEIRDIQSKKFPNHCRVCATCKTDKDLDDFYPAKRILCGIHSSCKICWTNKKKSASTRSDQEILNVQKQMFPNNEQKCIKCNSFKNLNLFKQDKINNSGITGTCNECRNKIRQQRIEISSQKMIKCNICNIDKFPKEFTKSTCNKTGLKHRCRKCDSVDQQKRDQKLKDYRDHLKNEGCVSCKFKVVTALHFAHIDRSKKLKNKFGKAVGPGVISSLRTFQKELKFLKVLCANCHRIETMRENKELLSQTKDAIRMRKYLKPIVALVNSEKIKRQGCVDCKFQVTEENTSLFDFDHIDPSNKVKNVSAMRFSYTFQQIRDEMEKCELRCANCHMIKTYKERHKNVSAIVTVNEDDIPDLNLFFSL